MPIYFDIGNRSSGKPPCQELAFHIGPAFMEAVPSDSALHLTWHERRSTETRVLLEQGTDGRRPLEAVLESTFEIPLLRLFAGMTFGGIRGISCPNLRIDCLETHLEGQSLLDAIRKRPDAIELLCQAVAGRLNAQWVVAWYFGTFAMKQVQYDAKPVVH
jgi:hypothetical protein